MLPDGTLLIRPMTFWKGQKQKKLAEASFKIWLGYEDSNLGMPESESGALPLGDTPTGAFTNVNDF